MKLIVVIALVLLSTRVAAWDEPVPPHPFPQMVEYVDDNTTSSCTQEREGRISCSDEEHCYECRDRMWKLIGSFVDDNTVMLYEAKFLTDDIVMSVGPQYLELCGTRIVGEGCSKLTWKDGVFEFEGNATAAAKGFLRMLNEMGAEFCRMGE
jgi:hypothetical protein